MILPIQQERPKKAVEAETRVPLRKKRKKNKEQEKRSNIGRIRTEQNRKN